MATVKELKAILDESNVEYPSDASKSDLEELVASLPEDEDEESSEDEDEEVEDEDQDEEEEVEESDDSEIDDTSKDSREESALRKEINGQKKVSIRLPKVKGSIEVESVTINGVKFRVPRGKTVEVPQVVADLLINKMEAAENAGADARIDDDTKELS